MRGSTKKQTSKGKAQKAAQNKKQYTREISIEDDLPLQKETIQQLVNTQPEKNKGIKWVLTDLEYVETMSAFHTHVSKRKGLNHAFDDAKAGLFDMLIIYKLDRFGRRSVESLNHALKFLRYCRIWVVDKNREFTNSGSADEVLNFIEFWSAKNSSVDTKIRVTDAMKLIHKEGYWTGGNPPYGYRNHPEMSNMLQVVPEESEVVKQIYRMYTTQGFGMLKISGILNEQGKKTRTGIEWKSDNIRKILRNTIYKGHLSYGKTITAEGEFGSYQKYCKEGDETVSDKYWEEYDLVGKEVWEKAQLIKKSRVKSDNLFGVKTPSRSRTGKGLLVGILKCECGSNMTYGTTSNWVDYKRTQKSEPYGIYRCLKRLKAGVAACGAVKGQYKAEELEAAVINEIKAYMLNMITSDMVKDIKQKSIKANDDIAVKLKETRQAIERLTKAKDNSNAELMKILMGEKSNYNQEQLKEVYENAVRELEFAIKTYTELKSLEKTKIFNERDIIKIQNLIKDWDNIFDNASIEIKRQMLSSVVSEVRLKGAEINAEIAFDYSRYIESAELVTFA